MSAVNVEVEPRFTRTLWMVTVTASAARVGAGATAGLVQLAEGLDALGFTQIPSVANFIAFDCGGDAETVYQGLLREGVIVRPLGGYGLPNHLRVTAGTARDNERFLQALKQVTRR